MTHFLRILFGFRKFSSLKTSIIFVLHSYPKKFCLAKRYISFVFSCQVFLNLIELLYNFLFFVNINTIE